MKLLKMVGMGLLLFIALMIAELLVTLPLKSPGSEVDDAIRQFLTWEFLLSALPALLLSYAAARIMRLKKRSDLLMAAFIWTAIHVLLMLLIAVGNDRMSLIFGHFAFYVRLAAFFVGPLLVLLKSPLRIQKEQGPKML